MSIPSIREQIISLVRSTVKYAKAGFPAASDQERERRAAICAECPSLRKEEYRCGECGCYLKFKIAMGTSECPINKWKIDEVKNDNTNE